MRRLHNCCGSSRLRAEQAVKVKRSSAWRGSLPAKSALYPRGSWRGWTAKTVDCGGVAAGCTPKGCVRVNRTRHARCWMKGQAQLRRRASRTCKLAGFTVEMRPNLLQEGASLEAATEERSRVVGRCEESLARQVPSAPNMIAGWCRWARAHAHGVNDAPALRGVAMHGQTRVARPSYELRSNDGDGRTGRLADVSKERESCGRSWSDAPLPKWTCDRVSCGLRAVECCCVSLAAR